jgi:molybdopterin molybdotransferase
LAADVVAEIAIPPFDRAAMDGYALRGAETFGAGAYNPLELPIVGESMPGRPFSGMVNAGQTVRIMTGAPMPKGADAVLPAEEAAEIHGRVQITAPVTPGRHVGHRGEDIAPGTTVLRAGRVLRPQDVGVLASIGASPVSVIRQPTISIIITGNELLPCGAHPHGSCIVDSNSVMLESLIRRDGGVPQLSPIVPDQYTAVRSALNDAEGDVILVSGGSSVGAEDHGPKVLVELGELCVHGVALRPASPSGVGFLGPRPVFLLPGNPVSCLCAYDLFAGPAIRLLGGRSADLPYRRRTLSLAQKLASAVGRVDYVRVMIVDDEIVPLATSGASILSSTTRADGFVLVPRDSEGFAPGDTATVYLYD